MDRSVRKILSLPLFGDDFCQWLVDLRMAQFEKLCAVSDGTIDEYVQAFVNLVPALEAQYSPAQQKTEEELARWVPTIEILFALVRNTAKTGTADLAVDLGFGLAEVSVAVGRSPLKSRRDSNEPPLAIEPRADEAQASLKARETGEARKWGMRLRAIVERCGEHATIAGGPKPGSPLSQEEMNALRSIVYESGGFRTIQQCVRHWERLETWARSQNINAIPLTTEVLVKYVLDLADRGCGPTVIPSVRGAIKWICKRIGMQAPDLADARIMALQKRVYGERGKETREAVPIPLALVAALERLIRMRAVPIQPVRAGLLRVVDLDHDLLVAAVRRRDARRPRGARHERRGTLRGGMADEGRTAEEGHTLRSGQGLGLWRRMDGGWMERGLVRDGRSRLLHEGARVGRSLWRATGDLSEKRVVAPIRAHNCSLRRSEARPHLAARLKGSPAAHPGDHLALVPSDPALSRGPGTGAGQGDRTSG